MYLSFTLYPNTKCMRIFFGDKILGHQKQQNRFVNKTKMKMKILIIIMADHQHDDQKKSMKNRENRERKLITLVEIHI